MVICLSACLSYLLMETFREVEQSVNHTLHGYVAADERCVCVFNCNDVYQ